MGGSDDNRPWVIYGLYRIDRNHQARPIFYIGRTFDMARRLKEHRQFFRTKNLFARILEHGTGNTHAAAEHRWIEHYRRAGFTIANKTEGGDGGQRLATETRRKISANTKGQPKPPGFGAKVSAAQKGKPKNWTAEGKVRRVANQFKPGEEFWTFLPAEQAQALRQQRSQQRSEWLRSQTFERRSEQSKQVWQSYTPAQRADRIRRARGTLGIIKESR